MTAYVFDSGPLINLFRHYYRERFPSLWVTTQPRLGSCLKKNGHRQKGQKWLPESVNPPSTRHNSHHLCRFDPNLTFSDRFQTRFITLG